MGTLSGPKPLIPCTGAGIRTRESGGSGKRDGVPFRARARTRDKGFVVRAARAAFVCRSAGPASALPFSINLLLSRRLYLDGL